MSPSGIVEVVLLHMESKKHHSHCGAFFVCFLRFVRFVYSKKERSQIKKPKKNEHRASMEEKLK